MFDLTRRELGRLVIAGFTPTIAQSTRTRSYRYVHLDVFTDRAIEGNQLLVYLDPAGLDAETMHALTRESNYSECTFVFPPEAAGTEHRVRIFTRNGETPFAGHPTIGTAFALAHAGVLKPGLARTVFGLGVGPTPIDLEWNGTQLAFAWMTQLKPTFGKTVTDMTALAAAIGLDASAIDPKRAPAQEVNCGSTFLVVPLATRKAVDAAVQDRAKMDAVFASAGIQRRGIYIFTTERGQDGPPPSRPPVIVDAYSRLLGTGGIEDPATGSAAGPAGCFMVKHGFVPASSLSSIVFLQGVLVRRPSRIHVKIGTVSAGIVGGGGATLATTDIVDVKVGGSSVVVGEGSVTL